jgi:hypothetical protein
MIRAYRAVILIVFASWLYEQIDPHFFTGKMV